MTVAARPLPQRKHESRTPPLCNGDVLDTAEFERRYRAMPESFRAELIEGRVYVSPPVFAYEHGSPNLLMSTVLGNYLAQSPGVEGFSDATVRLDKKSEPQPDIFLAIHSKAGGQSRVDEDGFFRGAPELAVEIAASSASYDLHDKLEIYRRNGVREYIVWRTFDEAIDYFILRDGQFARLSPDANGIFRSEVFPGLWVDAKSLLEGKLAQALAVVQQGAASSEHAEFVTRLNEAASKSS